MYVRLAGELELEDGARLSWSVADGRRGRRWRAMSLVDGTISHALLLEVDPAGRPSRLELTTPAGLLTLHPSADQAELHGNIVRPGGGGVEHLALPWGPEPEIDVIGRPLALAVGLHRRRDSVPVGQTLEIEAVAIEPALEIRIVRRRIARTSEDTWRVIGTDGLPDRDDLADT